MRYDASWAALFTPETQPPVAPALLAGKPDALCAELARLAYYKFDTQLEALKAALGALGLTLIDHISERRLPYDSQAFAASDAAGTLWLAFRGTDSSGPWDLITDLLALPLRWPRVPGRVHHGFREGYELLHERIATWLTGNPHSRMIVTGHSLGGALATLCAALHPDCELVTFGAPAVGDAAFAAGFEGRDVRRYRDCCDLVPRVPPEWWIYRQLGGLRYLDRNGALIAGADAATTAADMKRGRSEYWRALPVGLGAVPARSLADHAPINYVSAVAGVREPIAE